MYFWRRLWIMVGLVCIMLPPAYVAEYAMRLTGVPCWWVLSDFVCLLIGCLAMRHTSAEAMAETAVYSGELPTLPQETALAKTGRTAVELAVTPRVEIPVLNLPLRRNR